MSDSLRTAIDNHSHYLSHEVLRYYTSQDEFWEYALVKTTFTAEFGGAVHEVWSQDPSGEWDVEDADADEDVDLRDFDKNYNPTPMELLSEAHNRED